MTTGGWWVTHSAPDGKGILIPILLIILQSRALQAVLKSEGENLFLHMIIQRHMTLYRLLLKLISIPGKSYHIEGQVDSGKKEGK